MTGMTSGFKLRALKICYIRNSPKTKTEAPRTKGWYLLSQWLANQWTPTPIDPAIVVAITRLTLLYIVDPAIDTWYSQHKVDNLRVKYHNIRTKFYKTQLCIMSRNQQLNQKLKLIVEASKFIIYFNMSNHSKVF